MPWLASSLVRAMHAPCGRPRPSSEGGYVLEPGSGRGSPATEGARLYLLPVESTFRCPGHPPRGPGCEAGHRVARVRVHRLVARVPRRRVVAATPGQADHYPEITYSL